MKRSIKARESSETNNGKTNSGKTNNGKTNNGKHFSAPATPSSTSERSEDSSTDDASMSENRAKPFEIWKGDPLCILVESFPDPHRFARMDKGSELYDTAMKKFAGRVKATVDGGVNIDGITQDLTPLMHAGKQANAEVIKVLLNNEAKVDPKERWGRTALMYTVESTFDEFGSRIVEPGSKWDKSIKLLHSKGANLDAKDPLYRLTLLEYAINFSDITLIRLLIELGAKVPRNALSIARFRLKPERTLLGIEYPPKGLKNVVVLLLQHLPDKDLALKVSLDMLSSIEETVLKKAIISAVIKRADESDLHDEDLISKLALYLLSLIEGTVLKETFISAVIKRANELNVPDEDLIFKLALYMLSSIEETVLKEAFESAMRRQDDELYQAELE